MKVIKYIFCFVSFSCLSVEDSDKIEHDFGQWDNISGECGWANEDWFGEAYYCDGEFWEDPAHEYKRICLQSALYKGFPCKEIKGIGCCDNEGNLWFCGPGNILDSQVCIEE